MISHAVANIPLHPFLNLFLLNLLQKKRLIAYQNPTSRFVINLTASIDRVTYSLVRTNLGRLTKKKNNNKNTMRQEQQASTSLMTFTSMPRRTHILYDLIITFILFFGHDQSQHFLVSYSFVEGAGEGRQSHLSPILRADFNCCLCRIMTGPPK